MIKKRDQAIDADEGNRDIDYPEAIELPPIVKVQERRMQVRARNYWLALRGAQDMPDIALFDPNQAGEFCPYSLLLIAAPDGEKERILYLGSAIRQECGIEREMGQLDEAPADSLLAHIAAHYRRHPVIIEPLAFDVEFINQRGAEILSRGMLLPFAGASGAADYVYAVVNWKEVASDSLLEGLNAEIQAMMAQDDRTTNIPIGAVPPIWPEGAPAKALFTPGDSKTPD